MITECPIRRMSVVALICLGLVSPATAQTEPESGAFRVAGSALFAPAQPLAQIVQQPSGPPPTPRHTGIKTLVRSLGGDIKHLPSRENALWAALGGGLALAAHPFDDNVNRALVGDRTAEKIFKPGEVIGELGTLFGSAAATYAVGRVRDQPKVSHVGMDLIRALAISEMLTQGLKYTIRRERPDHSSRNSFPSGHAADTFAAATALERHLGWRYAVPGYIFASYVGISRMPANRHWLSDAVFGAAVGIIAGRTVTSRESQAYPVTIAYLPGGAEITLTRRSR